VLSIPVHDLDFIPGFPACPCQFSSQNIDTSSLNLTFSPGKKVRLRADIKTIPFPPFVVAYGGRIDAGFIPCEAVNIFRNVWHHEFGHCVCRLGGKTAG
jgi:hypothetical protein